MRGPLGAAGNRQAPARPDPELVGIRESDARGAGYADDIALRSADYEALQRDYVTARTGEGEREEDAARGERISNLRAASLYGTDNHDVDDLGEED